MNQNDNPYSGNGASGFGASGTMQGSVSMQTTPEYAATPSPEPTVGHVMDVSTQDFMTEVIEASKIAPVVVDFWAPWCGPCKQLGPIIEQVAAETKGVKLCKMDVEKYPEISQQMGIQSIPAVVAFVDGRPADAFMGAKPESEVRAFFKKLADKVPKNDAEAEIEEALQQAKDLMDEGDHASAAEIYGSILASEPGNLDAFVGLGHCHIAVGEVDIAQKLVDKVPHEHHDKEPLAGLIKTIALTKQAEEVGSISDLAAKVEASPKDHQARLDYALALNAQGEREEAAQQLIEIVRTDRNWNEDGARKQLLEFFEAWGNTDPATLNGRRALSSVLFS